MFPDTVLGWVTTVAAILTLIGAFWKVIVPLNRMMVKLNAWSDATPTLTEIHQEVKGDNGRRLVERVEETQDRLAGLEAAVQRIEAHLLPPKTTTRTRQK